MLQSKHLQQPAVTYLKGLGCMEADRDIFVLKDVTKIYPGTVALDHVDFVLRRGEIHALLGKNGAGKSTLTGIMYGSIQPTSGTMIIRGKTVSHLTPWTAKENKIFLVPQHPEFALDLTVAENMYIGRYPRKKTGVIDTKKMNQDTEEIIQRLEINVSPKQEMERVSLEYRQLLLAAKAFWVDCSEIIMLDEITATLSLKSKSKLFELLKEVVSKEEKAVVLITHRLQEAMEICNRVTVIRNGKKVGTEDVQNLTKDQLVRMITGESLSVSHIEWRTESKISEKESLEAQNLSVKKQFENLSVRICKGEIVGLAGLEGAGGDVLMRCFAGAIIPDGGEILQNGKKVNLTSPEAALQKRIAYLTRDREEDGVVQGCTIEHNTITKNYRNYRGNLRLIDAVKVTERVEELTSMLAVKMSSQKMDIDTLSGGNKQKVMIARLIEKHPEYYILDHITQGVDIHAKHEILDIVRNTLSRDAGILVSSESIEELMEISDRILVLYKGRLVADIKKNDFSEEKIFCRMQGFLENEA